MEEKRHITLSYQSFEAQKSLIYLLPIKLSILCSCINAVIDYSTTEFERETFLVLVTSFCRSSINSKQEYKHHVNNYSLAPFYLLVVGVVTKPIGGKVARAA